jgi:putative transposase
MHRVYDDGDERRDAMHRVYDDGDERRDAMHRVSTADIHTPKNQFAPQSKNLASIIRGFKSAVTMQARQLNPDFAWQSRFHDHIIRDAASFERISNYIINNPLNWDKDKFHGTV